MRIGPNIFLRSDGRWEARYQKGRDDSGKIIYGFVYGETQEEAERKRCEVLRTRVQSGENSMSPLASVNPDIAIPVPSTEKKYSKFKYDKLLAPLEDIQVQKLEILLWKSELPSAVAFYLSMHLGLSPAEFVVLKYGDIDFEKNIVTVGRRLEPDSDTGRVVDTEKREIPMIPSVVWFLRRKEIEKKNVADYIFTDSGEPVTQSRTVSMLFRRIIKEEGSLKGINPMQLRSTFVRRCLEANMNIESVVLLTGIGKMQLYKNFGVYIKPDASAVMRLEQKSTALSRKSLKLLILGAGSHGHNVQEAAERLGIFKEIKYLDDHVVGGNILGKCSEYAAFVSEFPCAFIAIGNNVVRRQYAELLRAAGFVLPTIIHPDASVSKNSRIGDGSIVMAQATVNAATVGEMCIVASNALVNFGANVGNYAHIDCGGIVMKDSEVPEMAYVGSGEIYKSL